MKYEEARSFIQESNQYGIVPGLQTITELLNRLGKPQDQLKIIHVAGTNGKGSTSAFIASILMRAGYRVGRYVSPVVFSYREMIQIGDHETSEMNYISKEGICETIEQIQPICGEMLRDGFAHPTTFEIETAMAMLYLVKEKVDFAIIEVGMGGRLDATNVIDHPICSVITPISMDHMQFLGNSIEEIAKEKAGIIKVDAPVVTGRQQPEVLHVLEKTCQEKGTKIYISDFNKVSHCNFSPEMTTFTLETNAGNINYRLQVLGEYQVDNAILAIKVVKVLKELGYPIDEEAIAKGLYETHWRGRFDIVAKEPYIIVDGAHNEAAALVLRKSIEAYFTNRRIIYIIGVLADKDYRKILDILAPLSNLIITLTPNNKRALASKDLAKEAERFGIRVIDAGTTDRAVKAALSEAGKEDVIIAFGSLSYLGDLVNSLSI
ncbi:MAG: bifunctional folylpolyglutamate synthase/dihydrofolate synthase [Clostridiales bacterium]|nr:bifunctional folylpolyglutamate synthase/dihydrofolate synthase [Clostridiales bacterium]